MLVRGRRLDRLLIKISATSYAQGSGRCPLSFPDLHWTSHPSPNNKEFLDRRQDAVPSHLMQEASCDVDPHILSRLLLPVLLSLFIRAKIADTYVQKQHVHLSIPFSKCDHKTIGDAYGATQG